MMKIIAEREQHVAAVRQLNEESNVQRVRSMYGTAIVPAAGAYQAGDRAAAALEGPRRHAAFVAAEERNMKHLRNMLRDPTTVDEEERALVAGMARRIVPMP